MTAPKNGNELQKSEAINDSNVAKPDLKGDWLNFFLLILLYAMQGMPIGLAAAVPILLQSNKNVSYGDQALFSLVGWPFSLKILWAPLVDALYIQKIGRRKSWLIPTQFLMGASFLYMSYNIDDWLPETGKPNIVKLVYVFFISKMLAATQDIAVDGWALTILKKNNVGYASTCQSTGQVTGIMISSVLSVLFTSENFSNKYLRLTPASGGVLTMRSLFFVWGILFMLITTLIALFKKEKDNRLEDDHVKLNIFQNYLLLWDILKLPSVRIMALILLTAKIGFAATDSVSILKLIDAGVSKDNIMIIHTAMFGVKMILPLVVSKYTSGPKPLSIYLNATPIRLMFESYKFFRTPFTQVGTLFFIHALIILLWNVTFVILIYYTPTLIKHHGVVDAPIYYYAILIFILAIHDMLSNIMSVSASAFFSRISDSRFGGTYMTLLNTLSNIGVSWTSSVSIAIIDFLTFKECSLDAKNNCSTSDLQNTCSANGGDCNVLMNGYYVEVALCTIIGILWYDFFRGVVKNLQTKDYTHWLVDVKKPVKENNKNIYTISVKL